MTQDNKTSNKTNNSHEDYPNDIDWSIDDEIKLLYALRYHKPVGVNRYFYMLCIHDEFTKLLKKDIPSKIIWKHLDTLYDMETLHENEDLPFPNDEVEFSLPTEFDKLKEERLSCKLEKNIKKEENVLENENNSNLTTINNTPNSKQPKDNNVNSNNQTKSTSKNKSSESDKKDSKLDINKDSSNIRENKQEDCSKSNKKRSLSKIKTEDKDRLNTSKEGNYKKRRSQV